MTCISQVLSADEGTPAADGQPPAADAMDSQR